MASPERKTYIYYWNYNLIQMYQGVCNFTPICCFQPPGSTHGVETKLQLHQTNQFITMASLKTVTHHVGVLENGQIKSALATHRNDTHAQFGVRLIVSILKDMRMSLPGMLLKDTKTMRVSYCSLPFPWHLLIRKCSHTRKPFFAILL